jgi:hypothetical protein
MAQDAHTGLGSDMEPLFEIGGDEDEHPLLVHPKLEVEC